MKVLQVLHQFFPTYYGGTETYTAEITRELAKNDQVALLYSEPLSKTPGRLEKGSFRGVSTFVIHKDIRHYVSYTQTYRDLAVEDAFRKVLEEYQPDIVHFQHLMHLSLGLPEIASSMNIPTVWTLHDYWLQCPLYRRITTGGKLCELVNERSCVQCLMEETTRSKLLGTLLMLARLTGRPGTALLQLARGSTLFQDVVNRNRMARKTAEIAGFLLAPIQYIVKRNRMARRAVEIVDLFLAPTQLLRSEFLKWGMPAEKIRYSADGIQDEYFRDWRPRSPDGKTRFGFVGFFIPSKGVRVVVDAFRLLEDDQVALHLFGGFPPRANKMDRRYGEAVLKAAHQDKRIAIEGTFLPEDIAKIYLKFDVLVVPSLWFENAPLVVKYAMLARIPVIASNLGTFPELISHCVNGYLFDPGDRKSLASFLERTQKSPRDVLLMGQRHPNVKTVKQNAEELRQIYKSLLTNRGVRRTSSP